MIATKWRPPSRCRFAGLSRRTRGAAICAPIVFNRAKNIVRTTRPLLPRPPTRCRAVSMTTPPDTNPWWLHIAIPPLPWLRLFLLPRLRWEFWKWPINRAARVAASTSAMTKMSSSATVASSFSMMTATTIPSMAPTEMMMKTSATQTKIAG